MIQEKDRQILHKLFRDIENVYGASYTTRLAMQYFTASVRALDCSREELEPQINEFIKEIRGCEPNVFPLVHLVYFLESGMKEWKVFEKETVEEVKAQVIEIAEALTERLNIMSRKIVTHGMDHIENGDFIIVHSVSPYLRDMLGEARRRGRDFRVLVLRQDFLKTRQVIKYMDSQDISYVVVPEYNLAHFMGEATKLFLGAMTLTGDDKVVTSMGTSAIVSLSHIHKLPVYLFVNSLKFSHKHSEEQNIHRKMKEKAHDGLTYTEVSHSHDIVDMELIDHLVIEVGTIPASDIPRFRCDY